MSNFKTRKRKKLDNSSDALSLSSDVHLDSSTNNDFFSPSASPSSSFYFPSSDTSSSSSSQHFSFFNRSHITGVKSLNMNLSGKQFPVEVYPQIGPPLYVVDRHHDALLAFFENIRSGLLPSSGLRLLHFDSHPDLASFHRGSGKGVCETIARCQYQTARVHACADISSWILPLVLAGHVSEVIWICASWCSQIDEGTYSLLVGNDQGRIKVSPAVDNQDSLYKGCASYWINNSAWLSSPKRFSFSTHRPWKLHVFKMQPFVEKFPSMVSNCRKKLKKTKFVCENVSHCATSNSNADGDDDDSDMSAEDNSEEKHSVDRNVKPKVLLNKWQLQGIQQILNCNTSNWMLDFDIDFLSCCNPFKSRFVSLFGAQNFDLIQQLYKSSFEDKEKGRWEILKNIIVNESFKLSVDTYLNLKSSQTLVNIFGFSQKQLLDFRSLLLQNFARGSSSFASHCLSSDEFHDTGMMSELPENISSHLELRSMLFTTQLLFNSLHIGQPAMITVATSREDQYVPECQIALLFAAVVKMMCAQFRTRVFSRIDVEYRSFSSTHD